MPQGLIIGIGVIIVVAGVVLVTKVSRDKAEQARQKDDDSKRIVSSAEKKKSFEKIIADLIQQKDTEMLNELLNDPNCKQFPDLIAKIKEELHKMG